MPLPYGTPVTVAGGCIRLDKDGPYLHENSSHSAIGISKNVCVERDFIRVNLTKSGSVVTAMVNVDETVGGTKGIVGGASGGVGYVMIRFFDTKLGRPLDMSNSSDYNRISSSLSNIWLHVTHVADWC